MEKLKDELKDYKGFIRDHAGKSTNDIPNGYFENMQNKVLQEVMAKPEAEKTSTGRVIRMRILSISAAAAVLVVLIAAVLWMNMDHNVESSEYALTDSEMIDYLAEHANDQDLDWMIDRGVLLQEDISAFDTQLETEALIEELLNEDPTYADELINI